VSRLVALEEACELVTDGTHYTPTNTGKGLPFLTVKDVSDYGLDFTHCSMISDHDYRVAKEGNSAPQLGDVLFSKDGTVGKVHVVTTDRPFAVLSSLAILRPLEGETDANYLGHALRSPLVLEDALSRKTGSAIRRIVLSDLKKVRIPLPRLPEQQRIAKVLDRAEALRSKRRATLAQLDTLTQSIFLDMFGDPESILGRWPTARLGELLEFMTSGSRGWAEHYAASGDLFLRIQNVRRDELLLDDVAFVRAPDTAEARRTRVQPGDVLLSITADLGRTAVVPMGLGPTFINQHLSILRTQALAPRFLSAYLTSPAGQSQVLSRNRQAVKAGLNFDDIRSIVVPLPPMGEQDEFARRIRAVDRLRIGHRASLNGMDSLFRSLQLRAFAGVP
jgi:type I restriction enzyme, S subunit